MTNPTPSSPAWHEALQVAITIARDLLWAKVQSANYETYDQANATLNALNHVRKALDLAGTLSQLSFDEPANEIPPKEAQPSDESQLPDPYKWPTPRGPAVILSPAGPASSDHIVLLGQPDGRAKTLCGNPRLSRPYKYLERGNMIPQYCQRCAKLAGMSKPYTNQGQESLISP